MNDITPIADRLIRSDAGMRFQAVLEDFVDNLGNIAAIAAIEVHGAGRAHFATGHVDRERTIPAVPENRYQIASQSKTIVGILAVLLHRDRVIDLDESVLAYIDLPIDPRITIRHLVMNQCGLGELTMAAPLQRWNPALKISPRDLVALALPQGQLFEPGTEFDYCNTGWTIAAMLIEAVCGTAYGRIVHDRILTPLGLRSTWLGGGFPPDDMLRGYIRSEATGEWLDTREVNSWAFGAGDGVSSLDDMLTLFASLCRSDSPLGVSLNDLTAITGKPSETPYFPMSVGTEYGIGIERRAWAGRRVWGHPGSTTSYLSGTWIDPAAGVTVTTCVTRSIALPPSAGAEYRYPREQLFAMALNTAYAFADKLGAAGDG